MVPLKRTPSSRPRAPTRRARALLLAVGVLVVGLVVVIVEYRAAVSDGYFAADVPIDRAFDDALHTALDREEPTLLSDVTEFRWETVTVFSVHITRAEAEAATGVDVLREDYESTKTLFVFCGSQAVTRVLPYTGENLTYGPRTTFASEAYTADGRLTDRADGEPEPACS